MKYFLVGTTDYVNPLILRRSFSTLIRENESGHHSYLYMDNPICASSLTTFLEWQDEEKGLYWGQWTKYNQIEGINYLAIKEIPEEKALELLSLFEPEPSRKI